ncbi:unnamed protein product [Linum tenue]|uniref:Uncharacterized protein n=1 Tax=Linum tenue TaxID=586396 RepID=A0AAV0RQB8_9ROSI|nr:unnamed protein product [Linum tenue]
MAKFNEVQKRKRAAIAERKRLAHGDPVTAKLKAKQQTIPVSGKRKRKLLKKWRRDQKDVVEKGLVTMEDVEMAIADGEGTLKVNSKTSAKFNVKKGLKLKQLKRGNRKNKSKSKPASAASVDVMVE